MRQSLEGLFDAFAGLGARSENDPPCVFQRVDRVFRDVPALVQVGLVEQKQEGNETDFSRHPGLDRPRDGEGFCPCAVGNQQVSGGAAHIAHSDRVDFVLTGDVPEDEREGLGADGERLLVDFHAHGGQVGLRKDAFDETPNQGRLADAESPQHAHLLLKHEDPIRRC